MNELLESRQLIVAMAIVLIVLALAYAALRRNAARVAVRLAASKPPACAQVTSRARFRPRAAARPKRGRTPFPSGSAKEK